MYWKLASNTGSDLYSYDLEIVWSKRHIFGVSTETLVLHCFIEFSNDTLYLHGISVEAETLDWQGWVWFEDFLF